MPSGIFSFIKRDDFAHNNTAQINERSIRMSCVHRIVFSLLAFCLVSVLTLLALALSARLGQSIFIGGIAS